MTVLACAQGMFYKDNLNIYRVQPLEQFPWLAHGFGTRASASFEHWPNLATLRQIHSGRCIPAEGKAGCLGEGDALLDNTPGLLLGVKTADCLPILMVDVRNRAVAAVHAGWRGTLQRVAPGTVRAMEEKFSSRAEDLHAAIGPGIQNCCFEVGPEVAAQFQAGPGRVHLDLADINRRQLLDAGVPAEHIYCSKLCTVCSEAQDEFWSYRRDKQKAGRMLSVVGLWEGSDKYRKSWT